MLTDACVGASAVGLPITPAVRPIIAEACRTGAAQRFLHACSFFPNRMRFCKILITKGAVQCVLGLGGIEKLEGLPDAIVAVRFPVIGHRCGCYKEQRNRQETCSQPFFHVFLLLKFYLSLHQKPPDAGKEPAHGG